jgi:hypothetical protein
VPYCPAVRQGERKKERGDGSVPALSLSQNDSTPTITVFFSVSLYLSFVSLSKLHFGNNVD